MCNVNICSIYFHEPGAENVGVLPSNQKSHIGVGASSQKHSSQKQMPPALGSPQKQAPLTNFFQPVNKKRYALFCLA